MASWLGLRLPSCGVTVLADSAEYRVLERSGSMVDLRSEGRNELFVDPAWWQVLNDVYGFEVCVLSAVTNTGNVGAALPIVELDDPAGRRIVSLPFCDLVDVPCDDNVWPALAGMLAARQLPVRLTTIADHPLSRDDHFKSEVTAVHHVVDLRPGMDELRAGFSQMSRRQIRRAARHGINYRFTTDWTALEQFYWLHVGVRKYRHQLLPQSLDFFEAIHHNFVAAGRGGLMAAESEGRVVGGCLLLETPNAMHYKFSAANPDFASTGVSHGAVDAALAHTRERGLGQFDFGRSELKHTGLVDFKRRFGPTEQSIATHRSGPDWSNHFSPLLGRLTELYVDPAIPDELTAAAGAQLYRYFA